MHQNEIDANQMHEALKKLFRFMKDNLGNQRSAEAFGGTTLRQVFSTEQFRSVIPIIHEFH